MIGFPRRAAAGALLLLAVAGCGVPTSGEPTTIPAGDVPYGLASPTATASSDSTAATMIVETGIYLVTSEDVLVLSGRELPRGSVRVQLQELLDQLTLGPTAQERADELSSALPPEIELEVTEVTGGIATVDLAGPVDGPSGVESRRAVGQIVLTATSLTDVRAVRLTRDGDAIDAPLPDGELTAAPLTAEQFAVFLTPPSPAAATTTAPAPPTASPVPTTPAAPTS